MLRQCFNSLALIVWFFASTGVHGSPVSGQPASESESAPSQNTGSPYFASIRILSHALSERSENPPFSIDADVPFIPEANDPQVKLFNQSAEKLIHEEIEQYRPEAGVAAAESSLSITFCVRLARQGFISILFEVFFVRVGGAHPVSHSRALNFDLRRGKLLDLSSLFKPGSDYLRIISVRAVKELKGRQSLAPYTDSAWLEKGAGAQMENYQNWTLTQEGLEITFDPYQVAAYVAGTQTVILPWEDLKSFIHPDFSPFQLTKIGECM